MDETARPRLMMGDGALIDANVLSAKCCRGLVLPALVGVPLYSWKY